MTIITLIKRDFILIRPWEYITFAMLVVVLHLTAFPPATIAIFILGALITPAFATENKYKTERYFRSLPVNINIFIISKYASILLTAMCILAFQYGLMNLLTLVGFDNHYTYTLTDFLVLFCLIVIIFSVIMPIYYLLKSDFRIVLFISLFAFYIVSLQLFAITDETETFYSGFFTDAIQLLKHYLAAGTFMMIALATPFLLLISYFVSLLFYKKRDVS